MKKCGMMAMVFGFVLSLFLSPYVFGAETEPPQESAKPKAALRPVRGVAGGVVGVGKGAKELVAQTVEETKSGKLIEGTVEGVTAGSKAMVDSTVRGAYRVATLGYDELEPGEIEHEEPSKPQSAGGIGDQEGGKPSRFKINF